MQSRCFLFFCFVFVCFILLGHHELNVVRRPQASIRSHDTPSGVSGCQTQGAQFDMKNPGNDTHFAKSDSPLELVQIPRCVFASVHPGRLPRGPACFISCLFACLWEVCSRDTGPERLSVV